MKLREILAAIEEFAPPALQEGYDNSGLLTGDPDMEITGAMLCLDSTEQVIEEGIQTGCNLIIAHHPIIFSGLKRLTGDNYVERIIIQAIRNKVAIYAAHTNLDNIRNGVNQKIAEKLGLGNLRILSPASGHLVKMFTFVPLSNVAEVRQSLFTAGAGVIGNYDECSFNTEGYGTFRASDTASPFVGKQGIQHRESETKIEMIFPAWIQSKVIEALRQSHPYEEVAYDLVPLGNSWEQAGVGLIGDLEKPLSTADFLQHLKERMNVASIRYTPLDSASGIRDVETVAVCGGAGSFLLPKAKAAGAQAFVSADFKYHQFFDADGSIMICDIGHYESEQFTPEIIADLLRRKFPTFATRFTSVVTNPINYY